MITNTKTHTSKQFVFITICTICLFLLIYYSESATEHINAAMQLCSKTLIPSLFPFMVISEMIVTNKPWSFIEKALNRICNFTLGISGISSYALVLGALCGFPIGTKTVLSLFSNGYISKKEAERVICFCNNPSSAFLINAVGISLYSSKTIGIILYIITLLSSALIGIALRILKNPSNTSDKKNYYWASNRIAKPNFSACVINATKSMLTVCAYVLFFSAITGCLKQLFSDIGLSNKISVVLYGFLELSGGVNAASQINNRFLSFCLSAFIVGWSGVAVHLQIITLCNGTNIQCQPYIISKLAQGILNFLIILIIYYINPSLFIPETNSTYTSFFIFQNKCCQQIIMIFFVISLGLCLYKTIHKMSHRIIH